MSTFSRFRTGTSSNFEDAALATSADPDADSRAGLVLLYAQNFEALAPAYPFFTHEIVIGRDPAGSICIPEQAVSRLHARIVAEGDGWVVQDLGSRNGTMVRGEFLLGQRRLRHGDDLRVGDAVFKFVERGAEKYLPFRIDGSVRGAHADKIVELVGGAQMNAIASDIARIAPTELSCLVLGETGTGKEVVARGMHDASGRKGTLGAINCAAIPHSLLESELFGYRRGAFSGADRDKPGLIKLADQGTLFLDEIGDMPLDAQAKLLRVLQSREVFPLGAQAPEKVDIRVVCATHRDLQSYVKEGKFRGDLYARLNEHAVRLPPLRDRKEDVYLLARAFAARYGRPQIGLTFSFMIALLHYDWPYNVRELESCIKRGIALTDGAPLDAAQLPDAIAAHMKGYAKKRVDAQPERDRVSDPIIAPPERRGTPTEAELRALLTEHGGNVAAVGRVLGKERMQIHRWLKKYNISLDEFRS